MKMELNAKNANIPQNLNDVLEKKLNRLSKHFSNEMQVKVVVNPIKNDNNVMEISVFSKGMPVPVRSQITTANLLEAVDILLPKLERQITKFKARQTSKKVKRDLPLVDLAEPQEKSKYGKVVKIKNFNISKTTVEDAIEEMELLDHNFHIFVDAKNNKVSVVYKRNDDDFGLITPEY